MKIVKMNLYTWNSLCCFPSTRFPLGRLKSVVLCPGLSMASRSGSDLPTPSAVGGTQRACFIPLLCHNQKYEIKRSLLFTYPPTFSSVLAFRTQPQLTITLRKQQKNPTFLSINLGTDQLFVCFYSISCGTFIGFFSKDGSFKEARSQLLAWKKWQTAPSGRSRTY